MQLYGMIEWKNERNLMEWKIVCNALDGFSVMEQEGNEIEFKLDGVEWI